jgi:predicted enzyme related to lactoylglutathione lyase
VADDDQGRVTDATVLFAGIPVTDFPAAVTWYDRLFGRPADIVVKHDEVMWRVADAAWLYIVEDPTRAGNGVVTVAVADLEKALAEMTDRGISTPPIEAVPGAGRKAPLTDPDGNMVALAEVDPH